MITIANTLITTALMFFILTDRYGLAVPTAVIILALFVGNVVSLTSKPGKARKASCAVLSVANGFCLYSFTGTSWCSALVAVASLLLYTAGEWYRNKRYELIDEFTKQAMAKKYPQEYLFGLIFKMKFKVNLFKRTGKLVHIDTQKKIKHDHYAKLQQKRM